MESKKHIFLSYSRVDSKFALQLVEDLKRCEVKIWVDQIDIPDGKHWDSTIEEALDNSCALILIMSPASADSDRVKDEVSYAQDNNIHIFPILYKKTKIPLGWRRIQSIEIDEQNYDQKIEGFIKKIANFTSCDVSKIDIKPIKPKRSLLKFTALFLVGLFGAVALFLNQKGITKEVVPKKIDEINVSKKVKHIAEKEELKAVVKQEEKVEIKKVKQVETFSKPESIAVVKPVIKKQKEIEKYKKTKPKKDVKKVHNVKKTEKVDGAIKDVVYIEPKVKKIKKVDKVLEEVAYVEPKSIFKKTLPTLVPLSEDDPYADIFNRYIAELQKDNKTKLVIISHANKYDQYDIAQKRAYAASLDLRERGLRRDMIETKVKLDKEDRVTFDLKRGVR